MSARYPPGEGEAYRDFSAHDARLHDLLLEIAGNETARRAFARTHAHLHLFRVSYGKDLGLHAAVENDAIIEAVGNHDKKGATQAMRRHLGAARDRLLGGS
jgi:DNA-binding GntR family transcriptional regulator